MKRIILCADDFAMAPEVSEAIISLIQHSRLSATSCIVTTPFWPAHAEWLKPLRHQADIGLHFNLTEGAPLSQPFRQRHAIDGAQFHGLGPLLRRAMLRRLDPPTIEAEFNAQLDQFIAIMGTPPDFIDGHQHIHQFPVIRDTLVKVHRQRQLTSYVRWVNPHCQPPAALKKWIISHTGGKHFGPMLQTHKIAYNKSFSGIYDFKQAEFYPQLFRGYLAQIDDGGIVMCHPATRLFNDEIGAARVMEYKYLNNEDFVRDCTRSGVRLERWSGLSK